jgi:DNA processing protein
MSGDDTTTLSPKEFPALLREIPDPPKRLFLRGTLPPSDVRYLCVVGSRNFSAYGATACADLIAGLRGYPIVIVSGLALGIDSVAHEAALRNGIPTIAVPGSGLLDSVLYPRVHVSLAHKILESGGVLLSESAPQEEATVWSFPKRNRLMAGLCHATLVIEAREKSGTLITARLALEYNRDVLVLPGPITSPHHEGSNRLLRQGAQAVTSADDILETLAIPHETAAPRTGDDLLPEEKTVLAALSEAHSADELSEETGIAPAQCAVIISTLEIKGYVVARLGKIERRV